MIEVSSVLVSESVELIHLEDTIIHEILHTCKGCMNHGKEWKALAEKVNRAYGYDIKRTASMQEIGIDVETIESKYRFVCEGCGQVIDRMRESKFTKYPHLYKCGKCGGKFKRVR
jgi:predicted SprT family Zn-dependent metalloprotease